MIYMTFLNFEFRQISCLTSVPVNCGTQIVCTSCTGASLQKSFYTLHLFVSWPEVLFAT